MEPFVLLRLAEGPAHGYELAQAISSLGFRRASEDPSVLYKLLRALEEESLAESSWADGEGGPPRRVYKLTRAGMDYLHKRAADLRRQRERIASFLDGYESLATRPRRRGRARNGRENDGG